MGVRCVAHVGNVKGAWLKGVGLVCTVSTYMSIRYNVFRQTPHSVVAQA